MVSPSGLWLSSQVNWKIQAAQRVKDLALVALDISVAILFGAPFWGELLPVRIVSVGGDYLELR